MPQRSASANSLPAPKVMAMASQPPISTRAAGLTMPAPPSQAPMAPNAPSAAVEVTTSEMRRSVWFLMNDAASSGTPAAQQETHMTASAGTQRHIAGFR